MRAAIIPGYGPADSFDVTNVSAPSVARPTDVEVAIHASSINPVDWKIRAGGMRGAIRYAFPRILGMDLSGVVTAVGPGVRSFAVGDEVIASPSHKGHGTYAETTVVPESELAPKPANLTHVEAATLPLVGLTAWACLRPFLDDREDARVLIMAGSGGVGSFAIQLAKHLGAHVATTCSARNHPLVTDLGADQCIDYHTTDFADVLEDFDLALDSLGGDNTAKALSILKRGGRLASISANVPAYTDSYGPTLGLAAAGLSIARNFVHGLPKGVRSVSVTRSPNGSDLAEISRLAEAGVIRPVVDRVFDLEDIGAAHAYGETGRIRGKVAIRIRE